MKHHNINTITEQFCCHIKMGNNRKNKQMNKLNKQNFTINNKK